MHPFFASTSIWRVLFGIAWKSLVTNTLQGIEGVKEASWNPVRRSAIITFDVERKNFKKTEDLLLRERVDVSGQPEYFN
jgi:hypothetical protein